MARVAADPMKVAMITATELLKLAVVLSPFLKGQVGTIGGEGGGIAWNLGTPRVA